MPSQTDLTPICQHINTQTDQPSCSYDKDVGLLAQKHFLHEQSRYILESMAQSAGKIAVVVTMITIPLIYKGYGTQSALVQKIYQTCAPRTIALTLLAASVALIAGLYLCHHLETKKLDALRDTLEGDDPKALLMAYQNLAISPAQLMKEAVKKDSKMGIALALLLIDNENLRKTAAQEAYPFAKPTAAKHLTASCDLKHSYIAKNTPRQLFKVDTTLFEALAGKKLTKFDAKIHNLASQHFAEGNLAHNRRQLLRYACTSMAIITGIIACLGSVGGFKNYASASKMQQTATVCSLLCGIFIGMLIGLIHQENKLTSQLLAACQEEPELEALLKENTNNLTEADSKIVLQVQKQSKVNLYQTYKALKIIAALQAQGLDPSASISTKAHLLAKVADTKNNIAINAVIAQLSKAERKDVIDKALLETSNFLALGPYKQAITADLFQASTEQILGYIHTGARSHINQLGKRYKYLSEVYADSSQPLVHWNDAPLALPTPLPMDRIIWALHKNHTLSFRDKLSAVTAFLPDEKPFTSKKASAIYTFYKEKNRAFQMSKGSAKILASWC
ncbi:MAG: hypothetical protein H7A39_06190 [Chlamydiales bacterium]|nr:hypothetical protein [Chlamydiales bacterium]